jgi:acetyl esterase/lipase
VAYLQVEYPEGPDGVVAFDVGTGERTPVFLAAGGEDEVAPVEHTEAMAAALQRAEVPVETLIYPTEGHGFYDEQRRIEYYTRLLDFLARHLGGARAKPAGSEG